MTDDVITALLQYFTLRYKSTVTSNVYSRRALSTR